MVAAIDVVDRAVRTKQVRERVRSVAGGAYGHESSSARHERAQLIEKNKREAGKLSAQESADLRFLWSGYDAAMGVRSVHGAVEDLLMRGPPAVTETLRRAALSELTTRGKDGVPRDKLVEILNADTVGATRYEARLALKALRKDGEVEFFTAEITRKRPPTCATCRLLLGEYDGASPDAPGGKRGVCTCGGGHDETVVTEMVRVALGHPGRGLMLLPPEERWARQDREIEASCHELAVSESRNGGGSRLPPHVYSGGADMARTALRRISSLHRRTIERVYGDMKTSWAGLSAEAARVAEFCGTVEKHRARMVAERLEEYTKANQDKALPADFMRKVDRSVLASDVLHQKLDVTPDDPVAKYRWRAERDLFITAVETEAAELIKSAVLAYRRQRGEVD